MSQYHALEVEAQPIADQWMGKCSCGWRYPSSVYDKSRDEALADIQLTYRAHTDDAVREGK